MKKLMISICALLLFVVGNVYAQDTKGAAMPGGKFTLGELDDNVYRNAWAGLTFTARDYYKDACFLTLNKSDVILNFVADDQKQAERLANMDFGRATAFYYSADGKGTAAMYVYNLDREVLGSSIVPDMGMVRDRDEFLRKLVEDCESRSSCTVQKTPYVTVLGGRDFMACDITQGDAVYRIYAQQIDNFLVMVYMTVNKEIDRDWLFKEFEGCFNGGVSAVAGGGSINTASDKFSIGEYERDTYQNSWMGMSFTARKKYISMSLNDDRLAFYKTDEASKQKLAAYDFDKAWALNYALERMGGRLSLYVVNLAKEQENLGMVKDCDDYIEKIIAHTKADKKVLTPQFGEVYDAVLGGQNFKAFEIYVLDGEMQQRYYVRQIDNFLVVVEMVAAKNAEKNVAILADFEASFAKYDAAAASDKAAAKPAMDMGEYTADGYRNAWLGVAFTAPKNYNGEYETWERRLKPILFADKDTETLKRVADGDYSEIYAFSYLVKSPIGSIEMYIQNIDCMGKFNDDPIDTEQVYIAYEQWRKADGGGNPQFSKTMEMVLGGQKFKMYETRMLGGLQQTFVRKVDNHFLVVKFSCINEKNGKGLFKDFAKCFTKY